MRFVGLAVFIFFFIFLVGIYSADPVPLGHSLETFPLKSFVSLEGVISDVSPRERYYFFRVGSVPVHCDCPHISYDGLSAYVEGTIEEFNSERYIQVYSITFLY